MAEPAAVPVLIRQMTLEDVDAVLAVDRISFTLPWTERSYRYELTQNHNASLWVAEAQLDDGPHPVVGMIVTWLILDEAHVGTIAVHPEYRRQGIGQRLLATCLAEIQKRGAAQALLEVRRGNIEAQRLYKRFGFEVVGLRPRYYRDNNEDAILMTLKAIDPEKMQQLALNG